MNALEYAREQLEYVIAMRRLFHRNPELSFQEAATTDRIMDELADMGIPAARLDPTGAVGEIVGAYPGKTLVIRAEIDALSIQEETDVPFRSRNPGIMHACGHDANTAMLLGTARILNKMRDRLHGRVRLLFQPAEEMGNGAAAVIGQGVLEGAGGVLALHVSSQVACGAICIGEGAMLPQATKYTIRVTGKSTHGALPQEGANAALAGAAVATHLQSIVPLEFSAYENVLISLGTFHSGSAANAVPEHAELQGTIRAYSHEVTEKVKSSIRRVAESGAALYRCTAEAGFETVCEALVNDSGLYGLSRQAAADVAGQVLPFIRTMASDNFSEYSSRCPSMYVCLGVGGEFPQHSSRYEMDEQALAVGIAFEVDFVHRYFNEQL